MRAPGVPPNGVNYLATQSSKPESKASITKHPLFPAMVAMWFGSLFGLGSLAVRASLIESLVLKLSLDVILPAAAPPLGLKFRFILALLLAAVGIAAGAALARWIAKPRPVIEPRRRDITTRAQARQARAAAAAQGSAADSSARRRPLALAEEEDRRENYEHAPLPGGHPAILDVTQIDLSPRAEDAQPSYQPAVAISDVVRQTQVPASIVPIAAPQTASELASAVEQVPQARSEPVEFEPVTFEAVAIPPAQPAATRPFAVPNPAEDAAITDGRQVFRAPDPAPEAAILQDTAPSAEGQAAPANFHRPFDSPAAPPAVAEAEADMPQMLDAVLNAQPEASDDSLDLLASQVLEEPAQTPASVNAFNQPPFAALASAALAEGTLSTRVATAPLAELSPVELIERLAMAMSQRAHLGEMPSALAEAVTSLANPVLGAELQVADIGLGSKDEPAVEPVPATVVPAAPVATPRAPDVEVTEASPLPPVMEMPAALRPIDLADFGDSADHDDLDNLCLPPRSFAAPLVDPVIDNAAASQSSPPNVAETVAESATAAAAEPVAPAEPDVLEEGYSSLLDLVRPAAPRSEFVRIEEPQDDNYEIEPVVLFPGHTARPGLRFAAPGTVAEAPVAAESVAAAPAATDVEGPALRRFDPPGRVAAPSGEGSAAVLASPARQDPEEAQRALRSALATLQRMSGAA
jgi:hypothetical protein